MTCHSERGTSEESSKEMEVFGTGPFVPPLVSSSKMQGDDHMTILQPGLQCFLSENQATQWFLSRFPSSSNNTLTINNSPCPSSTSVQLFSMTCTSCKIIRLAKTWELFAIKRVSGSRSCGNSKNWWSDNVIVWSLQSATNNFELCAGTTGCCAIRSSGSIYW